MALTVKKILSMDALEKAELVAGHSGIDNIIESISIMEVPDISEWLKANELLITTGYFLKNDPLKIKSIMQALAEKKIAALAIKIGVYLENIPEDYIKYSNKFNIPLILLPKHLSYRDFVEPINEFLINKETYFLKKAEKCHITLSEIALKGAGTLGICEYLGDLFKKSIYLYDQNLNLMIHRQSEKNTIANPQIITNNFKKFINSNSSENGLINRIRISHLEQKSDLVIVKILQEETAIGYLIINEAEEDFGEFELMVVKYAIKILSLEILKEKAKLEASFRIREELVELLIGGEYTDKELVNRAQLINFDLKLSFGTFLVEMEDIGDLFKGKVQQKEAILKQFKKEVFELLEAVFGEHASNLLLNCNKGSIINNGKLRLQLTGIVGFNGEQELALGELLVKVAGNLQKKYPQITNKIGIGRFYPSYRQLKASFEEAVSAINIGKLVNPLENIFFFEKLGPYRFLFELKGSAYLQLYYEETIGKLRNHELDEKLDLTKTLYEFIKTGGNIKQAGENLHIHKNTVYYRIKKAEEILGMNLNDQENRFNLHLIYKLIFLCKESD